jgi:chorismate-pyruvate lyase
MELPRRTAAHPDAPLPQRRTAIKQVIRPTGPDLETLFAVSPSTSALPDCLHVPASEVPSPYRELLVHHHHMTVTVEKYHRSLVNVQVLETARQGSWYARKILLVTKKKNRVVQFGIMRINLDLCSPAVRQAILREDTPLGRILIQHNVLRRIEPTAFLRITPDKAMMDWFGLDEPTPTYGRLAIIHCDHKPAVELLEIVAPG